MIAETFQSAFRMRPRRGFTLVEVLVTLTVACMLLLSVALIAVMSAKVMRKTCSRATP